MTVAEAYGICRGIARREAKNFYYAFLALPARKRDAICAVYAFMRHADDITDDEALTKAERRVRLAGWMAAWHQAAEQGLALASDGVADSVAAPDPVFIALNDARVRFRIPLSLLDQLVEGTAMDLAGPEADASAETNAAADIFEDFGALRRYCYLVASVVGLVCIRIFEYNSPAAEQLAEELGLAFQLTNILRDVREDAERGRVYLPLDELAEHGLTAASLREEALRGRAPEADTRAMLAAQAARAEQFYTAGRRLLPLVAPDSRPALWVLMTIYHRLLQRIQAAQYSVFRRRLSVPKWEKVALLARGVTGTLAARVRGARLAHTYPALPVPRHPARIAIVGAGVAGLSAGCALAEVGYQVTVFEKRPYVGGRASSYLHPGSGEVIDNCQHILLGCCTNLRSLLHRVGRGDTIAWTRDITYIEPGGRRSVVRPGRLPAPFQSSFSFLRARCFSLADKWAIARGLLPFFQGYPADTPGGETFLDWAKRHGQTPGALKRFWEPILQSALNDGLDRVSVHYAGKVMRDSFLSSAEAGRIGVPLLPLSEMYAGAARYIEERGGSIRLRTGVDGLEPGERGWTVRMANGDRLGNKFGAEHYDAVVLALPFEATQRLLPEGDASAPIHEAIAHFEHVPLLGVHLWFDREITELPHAVLLDTTIQWMYQRQKLQPEPSDQPGSHLELVVSVAHGLVRQTQREIVDLALRELALFFPQVHKAQLLKAVVTKEIRATFAVTPGLNTHRPPARTGWPGLFLAGDYTATGWPATMEGAARSGFLAAEAVTGHEHRFLVEDLPPRGFLR